MQPGRGHRCLRERLGDLGGYGGLGNSNKEPEEGSLQSSGVFRNGQLFCYVAV